MTDSRIPKRFDVLDELAHGEGEILLRARDTFLQREVVLRLPAPELARTWPDAKMKAAELRSARALAQVRHAGVVKLLDVLDTPDGALVVLEPVAGESLAEIVAREGRLDAERVRALALDVADALTAVHAQGVVHRGVSSASIVVRGDGTPCLAGFVFAKFVDRDAHQSSIQFRDRTETIPAALPPHPAPEQIAGAAADARADQFALGWVMYEALTGTAPYPRDREPETWSEPIDATKLAPGTPRTLASALARALKKNPSQRFASTAEFRAAVGGAPTADVPGSAANRREKSRLVPMLVGVAIAGVALVLVWRGGAETSASESPRGLAQPPEVFAKSATEYGPSFNAAKALLIGISDYSGTGWGELANAERDVNALGDQLESMSGDRWQVKRLLGANATKRAIKEELALLAAATQDPEARVFIYFAGHGDKDSLAANRGYVVPSDAKPALEDIGRDSYLLFEEGFDMFFERTRAKHVLLAVDCCYGGGVTQLRGATDQPTDKLLRRKAHLVFASSLKTEQAVDGVGGEHSPFARAFLDVLKDKSRKSVTSSLLSSAITQALEDSPNQTPNLGYRVSPSGGGDGQFVFFTQPQ